ncbi:DDE-type integrase/transposase/recombinase [Candidatus Pacearchaeota archaeon]|nr:DDE-type integrase/transposase/recombinase [Candidatus Pacearchaeota archaeon]
MINKIICPKCKSKEVIKWGKRKTDNRGKIQRYCCKSCSETFVNDPFFKMRNSPQKITCALDLFHRGLSTREVQNHFKAFFPHNSSNVSIYKWVKKYNLKIANFTDNLKINTGSYIEVDEMEYHRRKSHKKGSKGIDKNWFIDGIDVKTRFMINSTYVKHRSKNNLKKVLLNIKNKTGEQVKIIQTDGLTAYENIVKQNWGYDNHLRKYKVEHRVKTQSKNEGFNIWVERMHNSVRQQTTGFRGLHSSVESAYALMKGIEIFYNFVKPHEALKGKTPSELAIPSLKFQTPNRWLELIQLSEKQ